MENTLLAAQKHKCYMNWSGGKDSALALYKKMQQAGIQGVFPLWKIDTTALIHEFIELGFKTIVVCVNEKFLNKNFCGRIIDKEFINDLPANVDVCGENGEFRTFVFDGPLFKT